MNSIVGVVIYNEEGKLKSLLYRFNEVLKQENYTVLFVNDGSTDGTNEELKEFIDQLSPLQRKKIHLITHKINKGVGFAIKTILDFGMRSNKDVVVIMAGNGKDNPLEIPRLIKPIREEGYDYIQGSRFLLGGSYTNLPFLRKMMIRSYTLFMNLVTGFWGTDATNGFRAYKLSLFTDKRIKINQSWLERYELETYLHCKVISLGYKIKEVSVSKNYIPKVKSYSKIKPFSDWWRIMRPIFLLKLGIKS